MARKTAAGVKQFNTLLFSVRTSVPDHYRRQRFFDNVNTVMLTVAALAGFATAVSVISWMYELVGMSIVTGVGSSSSVLVERHARIAISLESSSDSNAGDLLGIVGAG